MIYSEAKPSSFIKEIDLIASTHLATGAAVGVASYRYLSKSCSPWALLLVLILGIFSHFILDMIPHSEEEVYKPDGTDRYQFVILAVELYLSYWAIYYCGLWPSAWLQNTYLLAGLIGGALPDVPHVMMGALNINWKILQVVDSVNTYFHTPEHPTSFLQGMVPQTVILVISLTVLYFLKFEALKNAAPLI